MTILGIETSCDETSIAIVEDGRRILSNIIASQMLEHATYGGVVPEVASRRHVEAIIPVLREALSAAGKTLADIDAIAVTNRPGLLGALLVGVSAAKALAMALNIPIVGVHHIEAHFYANFLGTPNGNSDAQFPAVALVVSGGHTDLFHCQDHGKYALLGRTRDDAAGEAFDKCARLMGLGYPGGPSVQNAAIGGNPKAIAFPRAWLPGTHEFSFSGLKTSVRYEMRKENLPPTSDIAASFQEAVVDVLVKKTVLAAQSVNVERIFLAGGVAANTRLREKMQLACEKASLTLFYPTPVLCTDNGAMIAATGYFQLQAGNADALDFSTHASEPLALLMQ
jgi:N6-L-threonylcarbamoyladenine synthase